MKHIENVHRARSAALMAAIVIGTLGTAATFAQDAPRVYPPDAVERNDAEALKADIALLAQGKGIKVAEAALAIAFQEKFVEYAADLKARYPDQISRIWVEPAPATRAYIQFTGQAPYSEQTPLNVTLLDNGGITMHEHARRAELAADALKAAGHVNFLTFFDPAKGTVQVEMVVSGVTPDPNRQEIVEVVRTGIAQDPKLSRIAAEVKAADIDLQIVRRPGEIYAMEAGRGGHWLLDGGARECTSGWSVKGPDGYGIITAAHCSGLDTFLEDSGATISMTWRDQERGQGDVEYHTLSPVEAEFHAATGDERDVTGYRRTRDMYTGSSVCVYGRSSNVRDCSHTISATSVTVTFTDGVTVSRLVRATGDSTIGGDSGGGWSYGTIAWGVHSGSNGTNSYFTPMYRALVEMGALLLVRR